MASSTVIFSSCVLLCNNNAGLERRRRLQLPNARFISSHTDGRIYPLLKNCSVWWSEWSHLSKTCLLCNGCPFVSLSVRWSMTPRLQDMRALKFSHWTEMNWAVRHCDHWLAVTAKHGENRCAFVQRAKQSNAWFPALRFRSSVQIKSSYIFLYPFGPWCVRGTITATATALRNGSADTDYGNGYGNGYGWTET